MSYLVLKTIHLISVIAWFAGLFYVGRLFIYFNEAKSYEKVKKKILQDQFLLMTKRCMYIITCLLYTTPSPRDQRGSGIAGCG